VFEADFALDGPAYRYKVDLMTARATKAVGSMDEDRIKILEDGRDIAIAGINRFALNKSALISYAELGVEYYKFSGNYDVIDDAMNRLKEPEEKLGDPDIIRTISRLTGRLQGHPREANGSDDGLLGR
jgi:hypothetical protein